MMQYVTMGWVCLLFLVSFTLCCNCSAHLSTLSLIIIITTISLIHTQYAYCIAAAHLQLPHTLIDSLMISAAGIGGEGWKFIKEIPPSETCSIASTTSNTNDYHTSIRPLPSLIHYCQRYVVDAQYFWGKRKIPHDIFTCDHPLLTEPPLDLGQSSQHTEKDRLNAFMICTLTKFTNDAMVFFKERHCEDGGNRERRDLVPKVNLARGRKGAVGKK